MILIETLLGIFLIFMSKEKKFKLINRNTTFEIDHYYFFPFKSFISVVEGYISLNNCKISLSKYIFIKNLLNIGDSVY